MLNPAQVQRYVRQLLLPEIGLTGQEQLASAAFEIPGEGLAAATARDYLQRAGLGAQPQGDLVAAGGLKYALNDRGFAWSTAGSPCEACLAEWVAALSDPPSAEQEVLAMVAGALAASQLMLAPLGRLSGASAGRGVGFELWPALLRREVQPREGCGCRAVAGG
jgi:hypothetical protein